MPNLLSKPAALAPPGVDGVDEPVIERPMVLKFQRADRMRHLLNRILKPMRPVIHRVDAPLVALAVMLGVEDAVHDRIAHVQVRRGHVNLRAQGARAIGELSGPHALK